MWYRYFVHLRHGVSIFANFSYGIVGFHMHDVTKIKLNLSILPRFYFDDAFEQLKTNFHTNFRFKRVLGFVIEYA